MRRELIDEAERFAKFHLENDLTGHDWWHVQRVARVAVQLAAQEGADVFICEIAALLHDVADEKLNESKESGLRKVSDWLSQQPFSEGERNHIMEIISTMSYNGGANPPMRTLEGKIVQDADRLEAIGAIAIARTFLYAGRVGHPLHDPRMKPRESMTVEEYRNGKSTAINHFYEKLLKLKNNINTDSAKAIAEQRHQYMEQYLKQFHLEWAGER